MPRAGHLHIEPSTGQRVMQGIQTVGKTAVQVGGTFGDAFFEMTIQVPKGALGADYTIRKQSRKRRQEHRERGRSDGRRFQDLMREQYIVQDGA